VLFEPSFLGRAGFYWFVGVVEDRLDPLKSGRVRVRCKAVHTADKTELPTDTLIWSNVSTPVSSSSTSGVGETPKLVPGTWVWGFFLDGIEEQESVICGTWIGIQTQGANSNYGFNDPRTDFSSEPQKITPTYSADGSGSTFQNAPVGSYPRADRLDEPDTSRLARNDSGMVPDQIVNKTASRAIQQGIPIAGGGSWSEPALFYNAVYPYNQVKESESGHALEFDDTKGAERVHLYHRTGSFYETGPDGSVIYKSIQDSYELVSRNAYESVLGSKYTTVKATYNLLANVINIQSNTAINITSIGDISFITPAASFSGILTVTGEIFADGGISTGTAPITSGGGFTTGGSGW